jgi:hypothetical protein
MTPVPQDKQYEHYLVLVEAEEKEGTVELTLKPVAADLSPEQPVTLRHLTKEEFPDNIDQYVAKSRQSMDSINDRFIEQVVNGVKTDKADGTDLVKYFGFVELVDQLSNAPHLLLANMCAAFLAGTSQLVLEEEETNGPTAEQLGYNPPVDATK